MTAQQLNSVIGLLLMLTATYLVSQKIARQPGKKILNMRPETVMLMAYTGIGITATLAILSFLSGR
jgi:hypothetical protein